MTDTSNGDGRKVRVRHNDSDREIERDRIGRWFVLIISGLTMITVPAIFLGYVAGTLIPFDIASWLGVIIGFTVGGLGFAYLLPRYFIITVGQVRAFVTLNPLLALFNIKGSPNVIYGPGDSVSYPWERRSKKGNVTLDIITIPWEETLPGKDTQLEVTGSYQFKVDITMADRFIGVDDSTILGGAIDRIKSRVSGQLATRSADKAKGNISDLNKELGVYFGIEGAETTDRPEPDVSDFEESYGIHSVKVTISGIDLPKHVQKTRDAVDEARQVLKGVSKMYGISETALKQKMESGQLSIEEYNNMLDRFAATSDNATMNVQAYKIDGLNQAARIFGEAFGEILSRNTRQISQ